MLRRASAYSFPWSFSSFPTRSPSSALASSFSPSPSVSRGSRSESFGLCPGSTRILSITLATLRHYDPRVERFDVVVVGAGPAGSTTAHRLASQGASVLLLDKARFPRDKPCGGGLTIRAVRQLPVSPDPVVEHVVDRMGFRLRYGTRFERTTSEPLVLMTQRKRLDHYLVERRRGRGRRVPRRRQGRGRTRGRARRGRDRRRSAGRGRGARRRRRRQRHDAESARARRRLRARGGVRGQRLQGADRRPLRPPGRVRAGDDPGRLRLDLPEGRPRQRRRRRLGARRADAARPARDPLPRARDRRGLGPGPARPPAAAAARRIRRRARPRAARRRRGGTCRPPVRRRHVRGVRVRALRHRIDRRRARGPGRGRRELQPEALGRARAHVAASWGAKIALDRYPWLTFTLGRLPIAWGAVERMLGATSSIRAKRRASAGSR